jgi:predicted house-cleaning noncanonical NTP pyrophosphatase (MazG superfamily)
MSGFEVAGVALAVLPILFAVLNIPASPKTLMAFRKRAYVGKLARALLLQKQTIAENIKSIASMSGCQHVWLLDDDPFTYLLSKQVQEQVLEYLGEENYAALSGVLSESQDILKRIAGSIEGLVPGGKVSRDNTLDSVTTICN